MRRRIVKSETGEQIAILSALLAITYFFRHFKIEESLGLDLLLLIVVPAFYISTFLEDRWKPLLLTFATHLLVFGYFGFTQALVILILGWTLFGITLLNVSFKLKLAFIGFFAAILLLARLDFLPLPIDGFFIPVVASIFMFRLIVYMYELKYNNIKEGFWQRASYFFMLPNMFILLFPIVDYKTYVNNFFSVERNKIYTKGLSWILLGAFQLVLYKLIYHQWVFPITEVENALDAFNFIASNYGLLIRVNGHFNIAVGILCLFGYNLHSPFHWFYFAPNFSEIWRRINTYWRDFVQKVFYYPMMFRYKKLGIKKSVIIAMLYSFAITYLLHSYQWFWLRGDFLFTSADGAFWAIFGILITINSVYLLKKRKTVQSVSSRQFNFKRAILLSVQTIGMFFTMAVLIALWDSGSFSEWLSFLPFFATGSSAVWLKIGVWFIGLVMAGTVLQYLLKLNLWNQLNSAAVLYRSAALGILALSTVYLDKTQFITSLNPILASIKSNELNLRDKMTLTNGYYESVINKNRNLDTKLAEVEQMRPDTWEQLVKTPASKDTANLLSYTLIPNSSITFKEKPFSVNQFGFRDGNYSIQKPDATTRIAFLGGSVELGSGVANEEVFEQVAEQMLRDSVKDWNYEILNYAIAGYGLIHHYENTKKGSRIYKHQPDLVLIAVHKSDAQFVQRGLINILRKDTWQQDSLMSDIIKRLELDKSMNDNEIYAKLRPHLKDIIETLVTTIKKQIDANGCETAMLYVPETEMRFKEAKKFNVMAIAQENGFEIISLDGAYEGMESIDLQVTEFDHHPNALAHHLLATKFFEAIVNNDRIFKPLNTERENS